MALVILNFKAYEQAVGEGAMLLAKIAKEVSDNTGVKIYVAPQAVDLHRVSTVIKTISQSIDPINYGAGTGSTLPEAVRQAGAIGSILNHSEKRIPRDEIEKGITRLRSLGMHSIVCSKDPLESKDLAALDPDYIAVEPPDLIGSGVSVSSAKPEIVTETVEKIRLVNKTAGILCGAGISTGDDVKKAVELGVEGVLLASAFTKAIDPRVKLQDICGGFK